jgi:DNA processing protein
MTTDRLFQLALSSTPQIGPVQAKLLIEVFGSAESIFKAKYRHLIAIEGMGEIRARNIKNFRGFMEAEKELNFLEKNSIQLLFLTDENYPKRLLNCYDSPILLFYRGNANLNASRVISIVGTRNPSDYGRYLTETIISDLENQNVVVVSGLAYGIDAIAHKTSIKYQLPTVGVLAHGLDQVYPFHHSLLAKEMVEKGGLLTEFKSNTKPDKHNFPARNRIVAGMSDALVVIETGVKGGSMITAELANGYNRDVFAFPGKITDSKSEGCNSLIRLNKAVLITEASELIEQLGWADRKTTIDQLSQRTLFVELTPEQEIIVNILREKKEVHIDELNLRSQLSSSLVAAAILQLELSNLIRCLPGKRYAFVG